MRFHKLNLSLNLFSFSKDCSFSQKEMDWTEILIIVRSKNETAPKRMLGSSYARINEILKRGVVKPFAIRRDFRVRSRGLF